MDVRNFIDKSEDLMTDLMNAVTEDTRRRYLRCLIGYEIDHYRTCLLKKFILDKAEE